MLRQREYSIVECGSASGRYQALHAPLRLSRQVAVLKAKQGGARSHAQLALAGAGFEWAAGAGAQAALPAANGPPVQACANRTHHAYLLGALHPLRGHCKGVSFRILLNILHASCPLYQATGKTA